MGGKASPATEAGSRWWSGGDALHRFVCDLVADELGRLRPGSRLPALPWSPSLALDGDGLGADSLELLSLGTAVAEAIHLHESGIEDYLLVRRTIGDWVGIAAAGLGRFDASLTFRTSGSTGEPRPCTHTLAALGEEVEAQAALFPGTRRILAAVPSHHIYGFLFTQLLPQQLGALPVVDVRGSSPAHLASLLAEGDLVVGFPDFWRAVARAVPRLPGGVVGVTSTAPCPPETATAVLERGLARLVQVYGSSETAGVAWRQAPDAPYELYPYWRKVGADAPARLVRGNDVAVSREMPDAVEWLDDRRFRVLGRRDKAVQVAGINVFPERISRVLCDHPAVKQASVRLMHPSEGNRLKAYIVPEDGADPEALRAALTAWIDRHLTVPERPRALTFGSVLPAGSMGKQGDWPVA